MRALLLSIVLLAPAGVASANDASEKQPEPPPPPTVKLEPPVKRPRPIAIHDSTRDPSGPGRSCEPNAMGQLECKSPASAQ